MKGKIHVPLPFTSLRTITGGKPGAYIVAAMFTDAYRAHAERLVASCERFGLAYELHEVPSVHRSISSRGTDDLSYTKPNFILHMLATHNKPILYMDADCAFSSQPVLIDELVKSRRDFAIYNWFVDDCNDRFKPVEMGGNGRPETGKRYYKFSGSFNWLSEHLLACSGIVQFYGCSIVARLLLKRWHKTIASNAQCADDESLAFTFNNLKRYSLFFLPLKTHWLPKSYARLAFWIYVKPVINHPDFPSLSPFPSINHPTRKTFSFSLARKKTTESGPLPRDCIVDTQERLLYRLVDDQLVLVGELHEDIWL